MDCFCKITFGFKEILKTNLRFTLILQSKMLVFHSVKKLADCQTY
jgi:hypothetical protein